MPAETYYHLDPDDYSIHFPNALDVAPIMLDKRTFIDAWIIIFMYSMILNVEQFLIDNKATLEV